VRGRRWTLVRRPPARLPLLFYSDGLTEQRDGDRDIDSGTAQVVQALTGRAQLPLDALLDRVLELVREPREDDIVVLAVRLNPLA
jgi:serine phosphatase RsbU (regulator of sigma subunit)